MQNTMPANSRACGIQYLNKIPLFQLDNYYKKEVRNILDGASQ